MPGRPDAQAQIATAAWLIGSGLDPVSVMAVTSVGGMLLLGVGLRLLEIKRLRLVNFLPVLLLAPIFVGLAVVRLLLYPSPMIGCQ